MMSSNEVAESHQRLWALRWGYFNSCSSPRGEAFVSGVFVHLIASVPLRGADCNAVCLSGLKARVHQEVEQHVFKQKKNTPNFSVFWSRLWSSPGSRNVAGLTHTGLTILFRTPRPRPPAGSGTAPVLPTRFGWLPCCRTRVWLVSFWKKIISQVYIKKKAQL